MGECVECNSDSEVVLHHVSYERDETVPVCYSCHKKIHHDENHPLYPEDSAEISTITVTEDFRDRVKEQCSKGESYEDWLRAQLGWDYE